MGRQYWFKKQDVRDGATDMRAALVYIERCMRLNDYDHWEEMRNEVVAIANQIAEYMKGK